jgi:predicted amidohydrolase
MKIGVANYPITFHENLEAWKFHVEKWVLQGEQAELLVFPEYGSMEMASILPEEKDPKVQVSGMQTFLDDFKNCYASLAEKYRKIIVAPSFPLHWKDKVINRVFVFGPKGEEVGYQDKWFMTPFERFDWDVSKGEPQLTIFQTPKGSFGIQICYDSEFSIGSRLLVENGADLILLPSCTETLRGATRVHIGARARALENQCYTAVSQTIGEALWSPAVDYNYGYTGFYSSPDLGLPEDGILQLGPKQLQGWLIQELDFSLNQRIRKEGGVRNFEDHQNIVQVHKDFKFEIVRKKIEVG